MESWMVRVMMLVGVLALLGVILAYHLLMRRFDRNREAVGGDAPVSPEAATLSAGPPPAPTEVPAATVAYSKKD